MLIGWLNMFGMLTKIFVRCDFLFTVKFYACFNKLFKSSTLLF